MARVRIADKPKTRFSGADLQAAIETERVLDRAHASGNGKRGRPRKAIDWKYVEYLASMGASTQEIAATLGVSRDTLERRGNGKIIAAILEGAIYRANVSIRRVLFGALRGRLLDPDTGETLVVPIRARIAMAKYLANRKTYLNLEASGTNAPSNLQAFGSNITVVRVGGDEP